MTQAPPNNEEPPETSEPPEPATSPALEDVAVWILLGTFVLYVVAAQLVGTIFPISRFDMYSNHAEAMVTRVSLVSEDGQDVSFRRIRSIHCEGGIPALAAGHRACALEGGSVDYRMQDQQQMLDQHWVSEPVGQPLRIVVQQWDLSAATAPAAPVECLIAECVGEVR